MRVVLDTETTGLDPDAGDRIVELGAVELLNHMPTGRVFHAYVNPRREVPEEAVRVHGLTTAFLADKPVFATVAADFAAFLGDSRLVIHNAAFDIRFLNAELGWCGLPAIAWARAIDTLDLAKRRFPGASNTLDALCRRFGVDASGRVKHGALLELRAAGRGLPRAERRPAARPDADHRLRRRRRHRRGLEPAAAAAAAAAAADRRRGGGARRLRRHPRRGRALGHACRPAQRAEIKGAAGGGSSIGISSQASACGLAAACRRATSVR